VIYDRVRLERGVSVGAGSVLGRPGFGWARGPDGSVRRIPQLGGVVVEADAEIGPLCTIDAGTLGPTRIGRGTKLDAHVHVGHNVVIEAGVMVAAQTGFAGSVHIGAGVRIGGQTGIADHVNVGAGATIAAKSGVIGDVPPGAVVAGFPAVPRVRWLRALAAWMGPRSRGTPR
jgi:UDP-3-O-[3-hydroxymyristoyl] glucosamine N-acyltransferase